MTRMHRRSGRLAVERLENRLLLDGNMRVFLSGGVLHLNGDCLDNEIRVVASGTGQGAQLSILGLPTGANQLPTKINGQAKPATFSGVRSLSVGLGQGNNGFELIGSSAQSPVILKGSVSIATGQGVDDVSIQSVKAACFSINTGGGNDTISLNTLAGGNVAVSSGDGADTVVIAQSKFTGSMSIALDAGSDTLSVTANQVSGAATLQGGVGVDKLSEGVATKNQFGRIKVKSFEGTLPDSPGEESPSPGTVEVLALSSHGFNSLDNNVQFALSGANFSSAPGDVSVYRNGSLLPASSVTVSSNSVTLTSALVAGRNDLELLALDDQGLYITKTVTAWAGSQVLHVSIVDVDGHGITDPITVVASLADDQTVATALTTTSGDVSFMNLPDRTILLTATASDNRVAVLGTTGVAGNVQMVLKGFNPPSSIGNNDFSQGTDGWDIGSAPVQIVPHPEEALATATVMSAATTTPTTRNAWPQGKTLAAAAVDTIAAEGDMDLLLSTSGEGEQTISRTFQVAPDTQSVMVRYRFITSEVPGGYFGSKYNDYFGVSIRTQQGGGYQAESNSMNGLGLAAFDAQGATAWREISLPVAQQGDIVQIDLAVANVGDGLYGSQVVVDYVAEQPLKIQADKSRAAVNEKVVFTPIQPPTAGTITWSCDGTPATGTGSSFTSRFASPGDHEVTATLTTPTGTSTDKVTVHVKEDSGAQWVSRFPTSTAISDLSPDFAASVGNFISALTSAGASVQISATYRPVERAYLMYYAWKLAREGFDPASVPEQAGVDISWLHYDANGNADVNASRAAAEAMVNGYGIVYAPALQSRHTLRQAIDMTITWSGDLAITDASGNVVTITSSPTTGAGNSDLWNVGASYGVHKLPSDSPHWSTDGH